MPCLLRNAGRFSIRACGLSAARRKAAKTATSRVKSIDMTDIETIVGRGYERDEVVRASQLLFRAEYKRFQAAPGPKMTPVAFGRDRRLPLTSGFNPIKP